MAENENEWGIKDIDTKPQIVKPVENSKSVMPNKEVTVTLDMRDAMESIKNGFPEDTTIVKVDNTDYVDNGYTDEQYVKKGNYREEYVDEQYTEEYVDEQYTEEYVDEQYTDDTYTDDINCEADDTDYIYEDQNDIYASKGRKQKVNKKNVNDVNKEKNATIKTGDNDSDEDSKDEDKINKILSWGPIILMAAIILIILIICITVIFSKKDNNKASNDGEEYTNEEVTEEINTQDEENEADNEDIPISVCEQNGHDYMDATCTEPKKCKVCSETEGEALGHDYTEATCKEEATCKRCGDKKDGLAEHKFKDATCTEPKVCTVCGKREGEPGKHDYEEATCMEPARCKVCGTTKGDALGHDYEEADCQHPKTCKRCGFTKGGLGDHKFEKVSSEQEGDKKITTYKCKFCDETKTEEEKVSDDKKPDDKKHDDKKPDDKNNSDSENMPGQLIGILNRDRKAAGLSELSSTNELSNAAAARAYEIVQNFSHNRPDGRNCFTIYPEFGVVYTTAGENIASGQTSAQEVENAWMNSDAHKKNMMSSDFKHVGIACISVPGQSGYYWVELFSD